MAGSSHSVPVQKRANGVGSSCRGKSPGRLVQRRERSPGKAERLREDFGNHKHDPEQHLASLSRTRASTPPSHRRRRDHSTDRRRSASRGSVRRSTGKDRRGTHRERSRERIHHRSKSDRHTSTSHKRNRSRSVSSGVEGTHRFKRKRSVSPFATSSFGAHYRSKSQGRAHTKSRSPTPTGATTLSSHQPASHAHVISKSGESSNDGPLSREEGSARKLTALRTRSAQEEGENSGTGPRLASNVSGAHDRSPSHRVQSLKAASDEKDSRAWDFGRSRSLRARNPSRPNRHSLSRSQRSRSPLGNALKRRSLEYSDAWEDAVHPALSPAPRAREAPIKDSSQSDEIRTTQSADMYNRGHYDPRYGSYPPQHSYYPNHSYPPSSYGSHAGSPSHAYGPPHSQHSYNAPHPSLQPSVPYHQPPSSRHPGTPNHSNHAPSRDPAARPAPRGTLAARGGRGHFANLSWTPGDGTKGGQLVQPGDEDGERSGSASSKLIQMSHADAADEDDNPFRPPADLRAEDESVAKKRKTSVPDKAHTRSTSGAATIAVASGAIGQAESGQNKISFSIKGRANAAAAEKSSVSAPNPQASPETSKKVRVVESPLVQNSVPKSKNYEGNKRVESPARKGDSPRVKTQIVRKKRLKPKPTLSDEFAQSDSVYFRKTGNDSVVGSGTYGKVYKAVHVYTKEMVALKKIRMEGERDGFPVTAIREIKLLQSLQHPNVVALQEVMVERNDCFMVFEYLSHDLTGLLNHPTFVLTDAHKKHLAKQLFESLKYLHDRGVLHRDIKAANILVSNQGELKLADFGLARFYQKHQKQDYTNRVITIWYRPPELLLGETQYGPAVDIWSAACVLVEIFTRHAIFPGDGGEINQLDKIYNVLGTPSRNEWPGIDDLQWYTLLRPRHRIPSTFAEKYQSRLSSEAFDMLQAMFLYNPADRPSASDVLEHPYFTSEEPAAAQVVELAQLEGDWHEFESKALRKEKEKQDREARRRERGEKEGEKRKGEELATGDSKKVKVDEAAM